MSGNRSFLTQFGQKGSGPLISQSTVALKKISRVSILRKELGKKMQGEGSSVSAVGMGTDDSTLTKGNK